MSKELLYIDPDDQPDWIKIRDLKERCRAIEGRLDKLEGNLVNPVFYGTMTIKHNERLDGTIVPTDPSMAGIVGGTDANKVSGPVGVDGQEQTKDVQGVGARDPDPVQQASPSTPEA